MPNLGCLIILDAFALLNVVSQAGLVLILVAVLGNIS